MTLAMMLGISIGIRRTLWMMLGEVVGVALVVIQLCFSHTKRQAPDKNFIGRIEKRFITGFLPFTLLASYSCLKWFPTIL